MLLELLDQLEMLVMVATEVMVEMAVVMVKLEPQVKQVKLEQILLRVVRLVEVLVVQERLD